MKKGSYFYSKPLSIYCEYFSFWNLEIYFHKKTIYYYFLYIFLLQQECLGTKEISFLKIQNKIKWLKENSIFGQKSSNFL
jgi:hypothetical protein